MNMNFQSRGVSISFILLWNVTNILIGHTSAINCLPFLCPWTQPPTCYLKFSLRITFISPESLYFFLQQLGMGSPSPGGAGRGLLVDSLLRQGLGEGQGAFLHYQAAVTKFESQEEKHNNVVTGGWDGRPVTDPT